MNDLELARMKQLHLFAVDAVHVVAEAAVV
jgi:hypothetical protein